MLISIVAHCLNLLVLDILNHVYLAYLGSYGYLKIVKCIIMY